ncbi:AMP-binding protein [Kitasatospora viridis]|uniref:Acetyl-CoA synthetase n=1 Tax=Kitasatospora viridis TaxID=281105 RepID=A0A561UCN7_9ACTN|nr:AMP-binding protein [Kitasatospora viridis]TWF97143.1 acetyl-CoA synthetase [Kitasatospora viridis]
MTAGNGAHHRLRRTAAHAAFAVQRQVLLDLRTDLAAARAAFAWPRPAEFNWALEWFDVVAEANDRTALEVSTPDGGVDAVSYRRLAEESDQVANWLTASGVARGERVLVCLGQQTELWTTLLAGLKTGAVVIPVYTSLTASEAADRVARGRVRHVVCRSELTPLFAGLPLATRVVVGAPVPGWAAYADSRTADRRYLPTAATRSTDPAMAYFTSGTTSAPKLVVHTHASYPIGHLSSLYFNGLLPGDRHVNVSAPGWAKHSWSSLFVPFTAEATVVALSDAQAAPEALGGVLERRNISTLCAPPSVWAALVGHLGTAAPKLREATTAGEPLPAPVAAAVEAAWGVTVREGYGQTETTALAGTTPGMVHRPGWLGKPLPGWDLRVTDGHIEVDLAGDPAGMLAGYDGREVLVRTAGGSRRYRTGDIGEADADGYLRVLGRADDVFKTGGHLVSPYELEAVLRTHPAVRDAAVVPVPHPRLGQVPHGVVEVRPGCDTGAQELLAHVAARVSGELAVRSVEFVDRLPRTPSGKIRRAALTVPTSEERQCARP